MSQEIKELKSNNKEDNEPCNNCFLLPICINKEPQKVITECSLLSNHLKKRIIKEHNYNYYIKSLHREFHTINPTAIVSTYDLEGTSLQVYDYSIKDVYRKGKEANDKK